MTTKPLSPEEEARVRERHEASADRDGSFLLWVTQAEQDRGRLLATLDEVLRVLALVTSDLASLIDRPPHAPIVGADGHIDEARRLLAGPKRDQLADEALIPLVTSCAYDLNLNAETIRVLAYRLAHSPLRLRERQP